MCHTFFFANHGNGTLWDRIWAASMGRKYYIGITRYKFWRSERVYNWRCKGSTVVNIRLAKEEEMIWAAYKQSMAFDSGELGLIPGHSLWHLWQTKWYLYWFISEYFGLLVSVTFHQYSVYIHLSISEAAISHKLKTSLNSTKKLVEYKSSSVCLLKTC